MSSSADFEYPPEVRRLVALRDYLYAIETRTPPPPGKQLLIEVRVAFIRRGTTLHSWCHEQGVNPTVVRQALMGSWNGEKGRAMRLRVLKAGGVIQ